MGREGIIDEGVVVEGGRKRRRKRGGDGIEEVGKKEEIEGGEIVEELRKEEVECGVKKKRKRDGGEVAEGWTKEQELALRTAYFTAKPSPHFWKNVSILVCYLSVCKIAILEEELILSESKVNYSCMNIYLIELCV